MAEKMLTRKEVEDRYLWNFADIFPSDEAWAAAIESLKEQVTAFAARKGHVAEDPAGAVRAFFELEKLSGPIGAYAHLQREADNADPNAQALMARVGMLYVQMGTAVSFLEPELLEMDASILEGMIADPAMSDYDVFLKDLLRRKPHTLPADQERLLAMMGSLAQAPSDIFDMLTGADMTFDDVTMPDGTKAPLTEGNYMRYLIDRSRDVRRQSFETIMNTYGKFGSTIASIYGASVRKDQAMAEAHNYESALEASLDANQIPVAVYDNLIAAVHEAIPTLNEYIALRKEAMGLDELHLYDLYTDIVEDYDMPLPFEEAFALVKESLAVLGKDYTDKLQEAHDNRWMDVYPTQNKSSGAFSMGHLAEVHPFIKLNHNDDLNSAFTMAHELGHSMHSYYSNTNQPAPKADYSLFVAEVASICNEAIMQRCLMEKLTEPKAKAYLLNHFLEKFRTTCFRQTMFAEFERIVHDMVIKGEPLTRETMSTKYYELNKLYYGACCVVDECIANEWMRIPHFYRNFYVYVYATGLCAAMALSARILTEGEPAVRDYKKFLSAGCSVPPIEALKLAGIDMSKPEPIRSALAVMKDLLAQFKTALKEANA